MLQREITEEEIKSLLKNPDDIRESFKERLAARKKFPKGTLEVVYKKSGDAIIIITCYLTKEG